MMNATSMVQGVLGTAAKASTEAGTLLKLAAHEGAGNARFISGSQATLAERAIDQLSDVSKLLKEARALPASQEAVYAASAAHADLQSIIKGVVHLGGDNPSAQLLALGNRAENVATRIHLTR